MKRITAKLGSMRKAADWVVYPRKEGDKVVIQCDKRICSFDATTGEGKLSASHNYPTFLTLFYPSAVAITVPDDVRQAALDATPKSGDKVGSVCIIA